MKRRKFLELLAGICTPLPETTNPLNPAAKIGFTPVEKTVFDANPKFQALHSLLNDLENCFALEDIGLDVADLFIENPEATEALNYLDALDANAPSLTRQLEPLVQDLKNLNIDDTTIRAYMEHPCASGEYHRVLQAFSSIESVDEAEQLLGGLLKGDPEMSTQALSYLDEYFSRSDRKLAEQFKGTELDRRTNSYPNFGLKGDVAQSGYLHPYGLCPTPDNYYDEGGVSWADHVKLGLNPTTIAR